jgi:hypothetical protein
MPGEAEPTIQLGVASVAAFSAAIAGGIGVAVKALVNYLAARDQSTQNEIAKLVDQFAAQIKEERMDRRQATADRLAVEREMVATMAQVQANLTDLTERFEAFESYCGTRRPRPANLAPPGVNDPDH